MSKPAPIQTVYSVASLIHQLHSLADQFDMVSFDLFDTLLVRRIHDPDRVKIPVAEKIAESAEFPWTARRILHFRNRIESLYRGRAGRSGPDHEATYPIFMADLLARIFRHWSQDQRSEFLAQITTYELELEAAVLIPRSGIADLLEQLHRAGKKILVISDMYLPATHLFRLLQRLGLSPWIDRVFSSADSLKAKASGAAWPLIQSQMQIPVSRWWHVGDNPISDGVRPAEFGVSAVVLCDPSEQVRKKLSAQYLTFSQTRPYWRGRLVQQWMAPLESENIGRSELYALGYTFFGPLLGAYLFHLAQRCRQMNIRQLFFLSREGKTLFDLWNLMSPWLPHPASLPVARYLEASRSAMAPGACAHSGLTPAFARIAFLPPGNRDARDLARIYGLDESTLSRWLARYDLALDTPLSRAHAGWIPDYNRRLDRLMENPGFQADVRRMTTPANTALVHYLESLGFFESPTAGLADIGWLGTIQQYIHHAVAGRADKPRLHGFLFASAGRFPFPTAPDNLLEGFIFDRLNFDFSGSLVMYARQIFEECTRANEPGLLAYAPAPSGFRLVHRQPSDPVCLQESIQHSYYTPLQEGVRDAILKFGPVFRISDFSVDDLKPWFNVLLTDHLAFPATREVDCLRFKAHINDFSGGHKAKAKIISSTRGLWDQPKWKLRIPGIRLYYYARHAVTLLR